MNGKQMSWTTKNEENPEAAEDTELEYIRSITPHNTTVWYFKILGFENSLPVFYLTTRRVTLRLAKQQKLGLLQYYFYNTTFADLPCLSQMTWTNLDEYQIVI